VRRIRKRKQKKKDEKEGKRKRSEAEGSSFGAEWRREADELTRPGNHPAEMGKEN